MKKQILFSVFCFLFSVSLAGCTVRTYPVEKERVDQELEGNRGYLMGSSKLKEPVERKTTRTTQAVEIEFLTLSEINQKYIQGSPPRPKKKRKVEKKELQKEGAPAQEQGIEEVGTPGEVVASRPSFEKYTVQGDDTLQKISKKFYGTSRKWIKIYEANKDILIKGPNSIYSGQVINIPVQPLKEPKEEPKQNFK